jgi:hypothetical protein
MNQQQGSELLDEVLHKLGEGSAEVFDGKLDAVRK